MYRLNSLNADIQLIVDGAWDVWENPNVGTCSLNVSDWHALDTIGLLTDVSPWHTLDTFGHI